MRHAVVCVCVCYNTNIIGADKLKVTSIKQDMRNSYFRAKDIFYNYMEYVYW